MESEGSHVLDGPIRSFSVSANKTYMVCVVGNSQSPVVIEDGVEWILDGGPGGHTGFVVDVACSPYQEDHVASCCEGGIVCLWKRRNGCWSNTQLFPRRVRGGGRSLVWLSQNRIAVGDGRGSINIFTYLDDQDQWLSERKKRHHGAVLCIAFDKRTQVLMSGGVDGNVVVASCYGFGRRKPVREQMVQRRFGLGSVVLSMLCLSTGTFIVTTKDSCLYVFVGDELVKIKLSTLPLTCVAESNAGTLLAAGHDMNVTEYEILVPSAKEIDERIDEAKRIPLQRDVLNIVLSFLKDKKRGWVRVRQVHCYASNHFNSITRISADYTSSLDGKILKLPT
jgi:WD40 repeat protein